MELDQVEVVGGEAPQAPLDAGEARGRPPLHAPPSAGMGMGTASNEMPVIV